MATLHAESRERASSAEVRRLRQKGYMPMALIVKGKGTRLIQAPIGRVREVLAGVRGLAKFELAIDDEPRPVDVVVKLVQRDEVSHRVVHMVLQELRETDRIKIKVPVRLLGEPESVARKKSIMMRIAGEVEMLGAFADIPNIIEIDTSGMGEDDKVQVRDLKLPKEIEVLTPKNTVLVTVTLASKATVDIEAELEAAAAEAAIAEGVEPTAEGEEAAEGAEPAEKKEGEKEEKS